MVFAPDVDDQLVESVSCTAPLLVPLHVSNSADLGDDGDDVALDGLDGFQIGRAHV